MLKIVLDTNILVSALHNPGSDPGLIVNMALDSQAGLVMLYFSQEILDEYQEVLARRKFHYIEPIKIKRVLAQIKKDGRCVSPAQKVDLIKADPADNKFLECALEAKADFLITGNAKHFPFKKFHKTKILTPKEFIDSEIIRAIFS